MIGTSLAMAHMKPVSSRAMATVTTLACLPRDDESSVTFTQPDLGFPTDVLDDFGLFFESQLQMSADLSGIAIGPGAFDQDASGMGVARFGNRPLSALLPGGIFRGDQAHKLHQFSWALKPRQVTHFRHQGDGHGELHPTQSLEGLDHRVQTPGFDVLVEFLFETLEAFGVFTDGADIFLKDDLLRGRGTDHLREPSQVGRAPIGPARVADIVSEQKGFETELGVFESLMASSRARVRSRIASSSTLGTYTAVRSPERASLASCTASLRSVLTRSPGFLGISEGATTQQS